MKQFFLLISGVFLLNTVMAQDVWVSDEIEAPLRASPELNSTIIKLLPAGQRVTALDQTDDYVKIETEDGEQGWLSNYYVLRQRSVHDKFSEINQALQSAQAEVTTLQAEIEEKNTRINELEAEIQDTQSSASNAAEQAKSSQTNLAKLQQENQLLQQKLSEQNENVAQLSRALEVAQKQATDERARYLSLAKVSENAVEIDEKNRQLQEQAVKFEKEAQLLRTENQSINASMANKERIIGALTLLGGIVLGYLLTVFRPARRRSSSRYT
ncbi:TIGR04211 family SH3 domain-containing protein [Ostreibacterium oceani]|uniref:TIGR04211 family SH3 domain-containing protein n=1 Tax=Ostreibacterium oceani TaxID=2654998 RepID=A0A6N7EWC1_9GAMM|nr:TIGR04211 family SH3 domain-containing protein [Ostreibacterium oceani]MPV85885.1 TIGR04211 family SH3 domain-containing protein [Ostreibacterium oceani]